MPRITDLIMDELDAGELTWNQIAEKYNVTFLDVEMIYEVMVEREDYYEPDYEDDGDALASAGMGTDEDYGYYGEEF